MLGGDLKDVIVIPGSYNKSLNEEARTRNAPHRTAIMMIDWDCYGLIVTVPGFIADLVG